MARWTRFTEENGSAAAGTPTTGSVKGEVWRRRDLPPPPPPATPPVSPCSFLLNRSEAANRVIPCLCKVSFNVLHAIDGVYEWHFAGAGLVVCAERGLVVTDRNSVVSALGEVNVTFAGSTEAPARVVYLHPIHNVAVIQYDVSRFEAGTIKAASLDPTPLEVGDNLEVSVSFTMASPTTQLLVPPHFPLSLFPDVLVRGGMPNEHRHVHQSGGQG